MINATKTRVALDRATPRPLPNLLPLSSVQRLGKIVKVSLARLVPFRFPRWRQHPENVLAADTKPGWSGWRSAPPPPPPNHFTNHLHPRTLSRVRSAVRSPKFSLSGRDLSSGHLSIVHSGVRRRVQSGWIRTTKIPPVRRFRAWKPHNSYISYLMAGCKLRKKKRVKKKQRKKWKLKKVRGNKSKNKI